MTTTIRPATVQDIPDLVQIIRAANQPVAARFQLTPANAPKHPSHCTEAWIADALGKGVTYFLLCQDNTPCGCVALEQANADVCYLERLAVLPASQRHGFGAALVRHALAEAQIRGARRVEIGTIAAHTELNAWYQTLGFIVTGTKTYPHLPFQVMFMCKNL